MSNLTEEILKSTLSQLQSQLESVMLEINMNLSAPKEFEDLPLKMAGLMIKLSAIEGAIGHAKNLYSQCAAEKIRAYNDALSQIKNATENTEEQ